MHSAPTIPHIEILADSDTLRGSRLSLMTDMEIAAVIEAQRDGNLERLRRCALGAMMSGSNIDSTAEVMEQHQDFRFWLERYQQTLKYVMENAPRRAFIEGDGSFQIVEATQEHITAAVRDIVFQSTEIGTPTTAEQISVAVFRILREAGFFDVEATFRGRGEYLDMDRTCVWGGHSINDAEYKYTKELGRALAMNLFEIITGCGPGAMRGPFSGATMAYKQRRIVNAKMVGLTCPNIITSEPPNEFVDPLIIMPDIEKRLEGFIRGSMGGVVVPGGVGTIEEILTILSILLHDRNRNLQYPLVFTAPEDSASYFAAVEEFLHSTLGREAVEGKYRTIINNPQEVAKHMKAGATRSRLMRDSLNEHYLWFGKLYIPPEVQQPFVVSHESTAQLNLTRDQDDYQLAAQLRRLFSSIVSGNVTDEGIRMVQEQGPFKITGEPDIIQATEKLLQRLIAEKRMKLKGDYNPCYELQAM